MTERRTYPCYQQDRFEIGPGHAFLTWPDRMTADELRDFNDWLDLVKRKINRIARLEPINGSGREPGCTPGEVGSRASVTPPDSPPAATANSPLEDKC